MAFYNGANCYMSYFSVSLTALRFKIFVLEQWNCCSCDNSDDLNHIKQVIDTWGWLWNERGTEKGQPLSSASENPLFITNGQRGNTIFGMFSFGQLCGWMLRFGVTHIQTLGVSTLSFPTQTTLISTRKLQLPPPFISLWFCFISQELFYKLICQATQKFIESCETKLRKTVAKKLSISIHTGGLLKQQSVGFWGYCKEASGRKTSATMRYRSFRFKNQSWVILETAKSSSSCLYECVYAS